MDNSNRVFDEQEFKEMEKAAMNDQLGRVKELYNFLVAGEETGGHDVACSAARQGRLHILQWLGKQSPEYLEDSFIVYSAVTGGHLHILQWLQQQPSVKMMQPFWDGTGPHLVGQAAGSGHLHIMQWLRDQDPFSWGPSTHEVNSIFFAAEESGQLQIMRWLCEKCSHWKQQYGIWYMWAAAEAGDLKALEWAQRQHPPFVMDEAIIEASLYLDVLKWLRTQEVPCAYTDVDRLYAQRASFIQEHLSLCGLPGELAVIIKDIFCGIEAFDE